MPRKCLCCIGIALLVAASASAQPANPSQPAQQEPAATGTDPLKVQSSADAWGTVERTWVSAQAPADLPGARLQGQLGLGRFALAGRLDYSGIPGEFEREKLETVRAASAYVAIERRLARIGPLMLSPLIGAGTAATLRRDDAGIKPELPHRVTAGAGLAISGSGWWAKAIVGTHHALRGVAITATWQAHVSGPVGTGGEIASIGTAACSSRACVATTGVGVRVR